VNGQQLVDNWTDHPVTEDSGTITLTAGQKYAIRMEFYEGTDTATARLLWSGPSTSKAVIPATRLFPGVSTVQLTLAANPAGLQIKLDGQPVVTPYSFASGIGVAHALEAVTPQTSSGTSYSFSAWSDGGAALHNITTPAVNTTYTATYRADAGGTTGTGLSATYYNNEDFSGTTVTRVDPVVDFAWGTGSPAPTIDADTFSVRWLGEIQPQFSGTYTFYTQSNDGVRLWVNGQQLVDNWTDHPVTEDSGTITLTAGQRYAIRMEFYEGTDTATARLLWSGPSTPKAVIPAVRLFP
jgi:hypothetical protein